ncbi:MAG: T9SS type A sorting domain-containing protein [Bacteroidetes bacterium]|nr:T9SS type A sorting domain-containing protein [Bacteroidota bacterium]
MLIYPKNFKLSVIKCLIILMLSAFSSASAQLIGQFYVDIKGDQSVSSAGASVFPIDIKVDKSGNFISLGRYNGQITFPVRMTSGLYSTDWSHYLIKFNYDRQVLWAQNIEIKAGQGVIDLNSNGDIFVGIPDFITSKVKKIDGLTGNTISSIQLGSSNGFASIAGLSVDYLNNIYVHGTCGSSVDIDAGVGVSLASGNFLAIYDSNLNFIRQVPLPNCTISKIQPDKSGNVIVSGTFNGTVDFNADPLVISNLTSYDLMTPNAFIAKYSNSGSFVWANLISSTGNGTNIVAISTHSDGSIYLTGTISGQYVTDFDPGLGTNNLISNGIKADAFLAKYNSNGLLQYAFQLGNVNNESVSDIEVDTDGSVYMCGAFDGTVDFDPSASTYNLTSEYSQRYTGKQVYLTRFSQNGSLLWASELYGNNCNSLGIGTDREIFVQVNSNVNYFYGTTIMKFVHQPSISSFFPLSGPPGCTEVTINGSNFRSIASQNVVKFNGVQATVISGTSTSIKALVPFASTGLISVNSAVSTSKFTEIPINVTINPSSSIICTASPVIPTLTASGASTYTWSPSAGLSATSGASVIANPSSSIRYTVLGTDVNGCLGEASSWVIVDSGPTNFTVNSTANQSFCTGSVNGFFSASGADMYVWSPSTNVTPVYATPPLKNFILNPTVTTVYTVTGKTINGCSNQNSVSQVAINVLPVPTVSISPALATICSGNPITFTLSGSGATNYTWTTNGSVINSSPNNTLTVTPTINGQTYQIQASNGICNGSSSALATVSLSANPPSLNSTLTPTALCSGATFSYIPSSVTAGATFAWTRAAIVGILQSAGNGSGSISEVLTNTTPSPINVTYIYVTSANGCNNGASPQSVIVTVNPSTKINSQPLALQNICSGSSLSPLTVSATGAGTLTYQWYSKLTPTSTGSVISDATTNIYMPLSLVGTIYYYVVVSGACGSVTSNDSQVTVNPATITITPSSASICANGSTSLTASGMGNYTWSPSSSLSASSGASVTAYPISTTVYTVTGNLNGCTGTKNVRVNVISSTASISAPNGTNACTGTVIITANAAASYLWSTGETTQSIYPFSSGVYTVTTYNGSCQSTASITIERNPNNCQIARVAMEPEAPTNQDLDEPTVSHLTTYPNPAEDRITVALPNKVIETTPIVLYDINGKVVASQSLSIGQWKTEINLQHLNEGVYIIRVLNGDTMSSAKVIVLR